VRRANLGSTRSERAFINHTNLCRCRIALDVLMSVMASGDPQNIPEEGAVSV